MNRKFDVRRKTNPLWHVHFNRRRIDVDIYLYIEEKENSLKGGRRIF